MRVIVIGGTGHVGTYLVPRLVADGHDVVVISRSQRDPYQPHGAWNQVQRLTIDREAADRLRDKMGSGVAILGAVTEGRSLFVVGVTKDLTSKIKAGDLIKEIAVVAGGSGGGRPDFAQAGGKDARKMDEALGKGEELARKALI